MPEPLSTDPYKGVRDFYPEAFARQAALFSRIRETLWAWGYEEYHASPLERAELYEAKTSEEIVRDQTYTFTDRGDRRVTLRPEMTPTLSRMVAARRRELAFPLRWFSIGNRFRYERPQRGRLREFYQADVDLVGLPEGEADLEVVALAAQILRGFGAREEDFSIRMSARPLLNAACKAAGLSAEHARAYLRLLDKKSSLSDEAFVEASAKLSEKDPLAILTSGTDAETEAHARMVRARVEALRARGIANVVFDPLITRGFDYYTGMVFEVFDASPENARSLFGGGRYDRLIGLMAGEEVPAVGFALGDVTLADFLETHGLMPDAGAHKPDLYLGTPESADIPAAQALAQDLRAQGCRVFVNLSGKALGDQVKDAAKRTVARFAAYGSREVESGSILLKTLSTGAEESVRVSELAARLRASA